MRSQSVVNAGRVLWLVSLLLCRLHSVQAINSPNTLQQVSLHPEPLSGDDLQPTQQLADPSGPGRKLWRRMETAELVSAPIEGSAEDRKQRKLQLERGSKGREWAMRAIERKVLAQKKQAEELQRLPIDKGLTSAEKDERTKATSLLAGLPMELRTTIAHRGYHFMFQAELTNMVEKARSNALKFISEQTLVLGLQLKLLANVYGLKPGLSEQMRSLMDDSSSPESWRYFLLQNSNTGAKRRPLVEYQIRRAVAAWSSLSKVPTLVSPRHSRTVQLWYKRQATLQHDIEELQQFWHWANHLDLAETRQARGEHHRWLLGINTQQTFNKVWTTSQEYADAYINEARRNGFPFIDTTSHNDAVVRFPTYWTDRAIIARGRAIMQPGNHFYPSLAIEHGRGIVPVKAQRHASDRPLIPRRERFPDRLTHPKKWENDE